MDALEQKIKKVMYTLTIVVRGDLNFWISKGFARLNRRNSNALYNYWRKKADLGDLELLKKIDDLYIQHTDLELRTTQKTEDKLEKKSKTPSLFEMAKNITKAATNFIKGGMKLVSDEELEKRLSICRSCDKFDAKALNGTGRCTLCGCATALKLKMATEKCPVDKWKAVD